jgi:hypothetical protein
MTTATVKTMLAGNTATLVDLNDWAVNTVREYACGKGYDAAALFAEERARISDGSLNLDEYLKASRVGSHRLLNRKTRVAVYAAFATRVALADRF